jgi:Flp pilus assembly protein TadG
VLVQRQRDVEEVNRMKKIRLDRRERGQSLVEFALVLPILVLLMFGIFDLGRAVYAFNTISNAARSAVRVAIVDQNTSVIKDRAIEQAVALGLQATDVDVTFRRPASADLCVTPIAIACEVEVVTRYQYTAATPVIGNLVGTIAMTATAREPVERSYESP